MRGWEDAEAAIPPQLQTNMRRCGFVAPTPIQMQAVPVALERRDLIGLAPTGSGKTCAFLLPLVDFLLRLPPIRGELVEDGPYALIMVPARELAI